MNGDKLTGTVVKVEGGKLTLKTDYAGAIEIQVDKVKKIITDNPAEVHLVGGEILKGKIKTTEDGKLAVEPSPERAGGDGGDEQGGGDQSASETAGQADGRCQPRGRLSDGEYGSQRVFPPRLTPRSKGNGIALGSASCSTTRRKRRK